MTEMEKITFYEVLDRLPLSLFPSFPRLSALTRLGRMDRERERRKGKTSVAPFRLFASQRKSFDILLVKDRLEEDCGKTPVRFCCSSWELRGGGEARRTQLLQNSYIIMKESREEDFKHATGVGDSCVFRFLHFF